MFIQDALNPKNGGAWRLSKIRDGRARLGDAVHSYFNGRLTSVRTGNKNDFDIERYSPLLNIGLQVSYRIILLAGMLKYYGEIQEVHSNLLTSEI